MATSTKEALSQREKLENQHDKTVREEIEIFRTKAMSFLAGEITEADFRPFRLKHGIYGQRQPGVQMVRCKIPGGLLTAEQVVQLGARCRRVRRRTRPPHHPAEHAISLRPAQPGSRPDAPAGRCRDDESRGVLQHGAQRDRLRLGGDRAGRSLRRSPVRAAPCLRVPAQGSDGQPAAQIQIRVRRMQSSGLHTGRHQRCRPARRDSRRQARLPHDHRRRVWAPCLPRRSCSTSSSRRSNCSTGAKR